MKSGLLPCSLLVPSRNRRELLRETFDSIAMGTALPAQIIIVDQSDAPDEDLPERIASACMSRGHPVPEIRYIASEERGLSRGVNLALRNASEEYLVFTHDDVRVEPEWLATIHGSLVRADRTEVVTGRVLAEPGEPGTFVPSTIERTEPALYDRPQATFDPLFPLNMGMHRSVPEQVGPFDERLGPGTRFPGAEDNEFGYRVLRAGIPIRYLPEAVLYHRAWRPLEEFTALRWSYGRGQGAFLAKHATLRNPYGWLRLWRAVYRPVLRLPIRLVRVGPRAFSEVVNMAGTLSAFAEWKWSSWRGVGAAVDRPADSREHGGATPATDPSRTGRRTQSSTNGSTV